MQVCTNENTPSMPDMAVDIVITCQQAKIWRGVEIGGIALACILVLEACLFSLLAHATQIWNLSGNITDKINICSVL